MPARTTLCLLAITAFAASGVALFAVGCGATTAIDYFSSHPACNGDPTVPFTAGDQVLITNSMQIAPENVGFDYGAGMPQNSLFALRALTRTSLMKSFLTDDFIIPLELFDDHTGAQPQSCVKLAFYYGAYKIDRDLDKAKTGDLKGKGDCNDHVATIGPGQPEIAGNGLDDNCDGRADETTDPTTGVVTPSTSTEDADGDGVTIADGDCNDHDKTIKPASKGGVEICGNGLDDDCSGVADDFPCDPYDGTGTAPAYVEPLSFVSGSSPLVPTVLFDSASISDQMMVGADGGAGVTLPVLNGGPNLFAITLPQALQGVDLTLTLFAARLQGDVSTDAKGNLRIGNGVLGGVLTAQTLDAIKNINQPGVGITPDDTLLDAIFAAGTLGRILALQQDQNNHYLPDVNVDGGQLETFWSSTGGNKIDTCQDNHGNVIMNTPSSRCVQAKDASGKFLFNDGLSVALTFSAVHAAIQPLPTGP